MQSVEAAVLRENSVEPSLAGARGPSLAGARGPRSRRASSESGGECPTGTSAAAARPSSTRLVVFLVGVVGLGKSSLARALCEWLRPACIAADIDQDRFKARGAAARGAMLAALHELLDEGLDVVIVHRNGPGSEPIVGALRARGVPWVCVYPSELLCSAPQPAALLGAAGALLARADGDAPGLAGLSAPEKVALMRNFFAALPAAAAAIAPLGGPAALPLSYFAVEEGDAPGARAAGPCAPALRWLLAAAGQAPFSAAAAGAGEEDAALARAAAGAGVRHRPLAALCAELGPRLRALCELPAAERAAALGACSGGDAGAGAGAGAGGDAYVAVFLARAGAAAEALFSEAAGHGREQLHVTLAHRSCEPAAVGAVLARAGLRGARARVRVSHRFAASWAAGAAGAPASVEALVVAGLRVEGEGGEDLLPLVASRAPHLTLRASGATCNAAAGAALRLLLAHAGGALPCAPAEFAAEGVHFSVAPLELDMAGVVATAGEVAKWKAEGRWAAAGAVEAAGEPPRPQ
jgi:hypothetical protein